MIFNRSSVRHRLVLSGMKSSGGFTLIELLISLTILSIIVMMVFLGMRTGIRAWERGERDIEMLQKRRIVLNLIKQQIASACTPAGSQKANLSCEFKGDEYSMAFVSVLPLIPGHETFGRVEVEYKIERALEGEAALLFSEKPIGNLVMANKTNGFKNEADSDRFHNLLSGAEEITFSYCRTYSLADGGLKWESAASPPGGKQQAPKAVKVCLKEKNDQKPSCIIARIQQ